MIIPAAKLLFGSIGSVINTATAVSALFGVVYLADCRMSAPSFNESQGCYLQAASFMGIGAAGKLGFETYNPNLRPPGSPPAGGPGGMLARMVGPRKKDG